MPVSFTKVNSFVQYLATEDIDLNGAGIVIALTNTAVNATATSISGVSQIGYGHVSSRAIVVSTASQTAGTFKLNYQDHVLTADGTVPAFRYIVLYDDSSTSDRLIGIYDNGSSVNMTANDTYTINFSSANGVLTIA